MPLELSLFCDESGSDALDSRYYLLTLVIHDQSDSIVNSITRYERALVDKGLPDLAFHAAPLRQRRVQESHTGNPQEDAVLVSCVFQASTNQILGIFGKNPGAPIA